MTISAHFSPSILKLDAQSMLTEFDQNFGFQPHSVYQAQADHVPVVIFKKFAVKCKELSQQVTPTPDFFAT